MHYKCLNISTKMKILEKGWNPAWICGQKKCGNRVMFHARQNFWVVCRSDSFCIIFHTNSWGRWTKWPSAITRLIWCLIWWFVSIEMIMTIHVHDTECHYWDKSVIKQHHIQTRFIVIFQIKAYNNKQFVTSSIDQTMTLWNYNTGIAVCHLKGKVHVVLW